MPSLHSKRSNQLGSYIVFTYRPPRHSDDVRLGIERHDVTCFKCVSDVLHRLLHAPRTVVTATTVVCCPRRYECLHQYERRSAFTRLRISVVLRVDREARHIVGYYCHFILRRWSLVYLISLMVQCTYPISKD